MANHKSSSGQFLSDMFKYNKRNTLLLATVLVLPLLLIVNQQVKAEYADVVLNRNSEKEGVRPVIYPHWFHRIRFQCRVCHSELGFEMRVGANNVTMEEIIDGKYALLFSTPETLLSRTSRGRKILLTDSIRKRIRGIFVDECHVVTKWYVYFTLYTSL